MSLSVDRALQKAKRLTSKGDVQLAMQTYLGILQKNPNNKRAMLALETLRQQINTIVVPNNEPTPQPTQQQTNELIALYTQGKLVEALRQGEALATQFPKTAFIPNLLGAVNGALGYEDQSITNYQSAIGINPNYAEAHNNLGNALGASGKIQEAMASYETALQLNPNLADVHINLANALNTLGNPEAAISSCKRAMQIRPDYAEAYNNMGNALSDLEKIDEALTSYINAVRIKPDYAIAHYNLANTLKKLDRTEEAVVSYSNALQINPAYAKAQYNISNTLNDLGRLEEAVAGYHKTILLKPDDAEVHNNLGVALRDLGYLDEALTSCTRALQLDPDYAEAHFNISYYWLLQGQFKRGWTEYEWRSKAKKDLGILQHPSPQWKGESLQNKTLLLTSEQGVGDEIMFASCIPDIVASPFKSLMLMCDKRLMPLFSRSFPNIKMLEKKESTYVELLAHKEPVDFHCSMGSLPSLFRNQTDQFPAENAYLIADTTLVEKWRERFSKLDEKMTIGISWQGGKTIKEESSRSIELQLWLSIFNQNANFVSLQYGDHSEEISNFGLSTGIHLHQWQDVDPLTDLDNFAAQMTALDLVISIDNSTVHMAGSLGVQTWTLLPHNSDWRWLLDCENSLWYPSIRLFRQREKGDWSDPLNAANTALLDLIAARF